MKHRLVHLSDKNINLISFSKDLFIKSNNDAERSRMKKILSRAIEEELTEKQRVCITAYYVEGKRMRAIAEELGVVPSTVTRHIKSAKNRLLQIAKYYM